MLLHGWTLLFPLENAPHARYGTASALLFVPATSSVNARELAHQAQARPLEPDTKRTRFSASLSIWLSEQIHKPTSCSCCREFCLGIWLVPDRYSYGKPREGRSIDVDGGQGELRFVEVAPLGCAPWRFVRGSRFVLERDSACGIAVVDYVFISLK